MANRKCEATTQAGKPCKNTAIVDGKCLSHAPKEARDSRGFGGAQEGAGRPKLPTISDRIRERLEERADELIDKLFAGLDSQAAKVVGNGAHAHLEFHEDRGEILRTIREILDRTEGRPTQNAEVTAHVHNSNQEGLVREIDKLLEWVSEQKADEQLLKIQELTEELAREKLGQE